MHLPTPRHPGSLKGEFWGITVYFNPDGYANKLDHLKVFSARIRQQGLKLLIVEAAFDDESFVVNESLADKVIRVRAGAVLWQKERLLNVGIEQLPDACDKVVWLDADILFQNDAWIKETSELLEKFVVVQPYDVACWLPRGVQTPSFDYSPGSFDMLKAGLAYTQYHKGDRGLLLGHMGFAWAARRNLLANHRLYDRFIVGGGDLAVSWAIYGDALQFDARKWMAHTCCESQIKDLLPWFEAFHDEVRGSASYTSGLVCHLWHGRLADREYVERSRILKDEHFDPTVDIAIDENCCWKWSSNKSELHVKVKQYFQSRREDEVRVNSERA